MSACFNPAGKGTAVQGLLTEARDRLAGWLERDHAALPGLPAKQYAERLMLHHLLALIHYRDGGDAVLAMQEFCDRDVDELLELEGCA